MVSPDKPADVAAMQQELDALRDRNRQLEQGGGEVTSHRRRLAGMVRSTSVVVLLVLATLCATLSPITVWGRNLVLNTDRYVETLAPVAANPGVQRLVIKAVDTQVDAHIDIPALVAQTLPPKASVLASPLQSAVEGLVNTITTRFVQSPDFQRLWVQINRSAHTQLVYLLTGKKPPVNGIQVNSSGKLVLQLAPVVAAVKSKLISAGLTVATHIPPVGATITIAQVGGIEKARKAVRLLNTLADVLPWLALLLFAGAIAAARRRRRAFTTAALCIVGGMLLIGLILLIARHLYLGAIDPTTVPHATAQFVFDTLVRFLRHGIRIVLLVALLLALAAWVTGPSRRIVAARHGIVSGTRAGATRLVSGPAGPFVTEHTKACRVSVIGGALAILVLFTNLSLVSVIVLAVIVVILLLSMEGIKAAAARGSTGVVVADPPTAPT